MVQPWERDFIGRYAIGRGIDMGCGRAKIGTFGLDAAALPDVDLVCDMARVPLPDSSQDYILACHSLEHHPDTTLVLGEWYRLLKRGGVLAISVPNGELELAGVLGDPTHKQLFTPLTLTKFLAFSGFRLLDIGTRDKALFAIARKP